jgi:hypothetical protein
MFVKLRLRNCFLLAILALASLADAPARTQAQQAWAQAGVLTCKLNPSVGFIIFGHQSMECKFQQVAPYPMQAYDGALNTVGLDIGVTGTGAFAWAVFAPTTGLDPGALAGEYVGASADAGLGLGAGANVLIGGSSRSIALQPVSVEGSIAVNAVLGLSALKLRPVQL